MTRTILLGLLLGLAAATMPACDACSAAIAIHEQRCLDGDSDSCAWLQHNAPAPACVASG